MSYTLSPKEQQNQTDQSNYSKINYNLSRLNLEATSKKRLQIRAIPPIERRGRGFFRIIDDNSVIIADQLSDYKKAQVYFEREEVNHE